MYYNNRFSMILEVLTQATPTPAGVTFSYQYIANAILGLISVATPFLFNRFIALSNNLKEERETNLMQQALIEQNKKDHADLEKEFKDLKKQSEERHNMYVNTMNEIKTMLEKYHRENETRVTVLEELVKRMDK